MRENLVANTVKKDKEIRSALASYWLVLSLFGLIALVNLPFLFAFLEKGNLLIGLLQTILFLCSFGIFFLSVKRIIELRELRENIERNPEKYLETKVPKPLFVSTLFPFLSE